MNIETIIVEKTRGYPLYSQEKTALSDKLVLAKLFNAFGPGTWYITEYDPESRIAFAYVEGLLEDPYCDEWGAISIKELAELTIGPNIPAIEADLFFIPKKFGEIGVRGQH